MIPQCNVLKRAPLHSTSQFPFVSNPLWTQLLCPNFIDSRVEAHAIRSYNKSVVHLGFKFWFFDAYSQAHFIILHYFLS